MGIGEVILGDYFQLYPREGTGSEIQYQLLTGSAKNQTGWNDATSIR
ncbi:MAG: hypothetical protein WA110_01735 [Anaerolineaceae bacterium]